MTAEPLRRAEPSPDSRSYICPSGHVLSRKHVTQVWAARQIGRCPYFGCVCRFFVTATGIGGDGTRAYAPHWLSVKQLQRLGDRPTVEEIFAVLALE